MLEEKTEALFDAQPYEVDFSATVVAVHGDLVALDRTLFYPVGGGQPADTGELVSPTSERIQVVGAARGEVNRSIIWHRLDRVGALQAGMPVRGQIDWSTRYKYMKMHTCLHLLCSMIAAPVTGCGIGRERGRLDFDLPEISLSREAITDGLNILIRRGVDVTTHLVPSTEHDRVLSLVRNKYALPPRSDNAVKIIQVGDIDIQPCGGTHLRNTAEIGEAVCEKIEKKGRQNRRIVIGFVT
jgi:Ser-tRNA(Ala) deacylase AlaX